MQRKLIVTALGGFGLGALLSWAITNDVHVNRRIREMEDYAALLKDKTDHIFVLKGRIVVLEREIGSTSSSEEDPNQESLLLDNVELKSVEIGPGPNAHGGVIEEVEGQEVPEGETLEETRTNLQALIDTYTADPTAQAQFAEIVVNAEEYDKTPPFVISRTDYAYGEEGEHHEKITLTYYVRDRVLLDDDDDPIDDVPGMVGWRNLTQFGGESEDPNVVFVRNRRLMTDFEVIKEEDSELPLHVKYGMGKEEFLVNKAAGLIKLRREDE